jgi:hypothetical protein
VQAAVEQRDEAASEPLPAIDERQGRRFDLGRGPAQAAGNRSADLLDTERFLEPGRRHENPDPGHWLPLGCARFDDLPAPEDRSRWWAAIAVGIRSSEV